MNNERTADTQLKMPSANEPLWALRVINLLILFLNQIRLVLHY